MNKVCLVGRITRDPEIRYTSSGIANVLFTIAVNRQFQSQNGERQADFISCVVWRQTAEYMAKYIRKGYLLSVEGRIQTRNYQDQSGQTRYITEVVCDSVNNLTPRDHENSQNNFSQSQNSYQKSNNSYQSQGYQNNFSSRNNNSYSQNSYNNQNNSSSEQKPDDKSFNVVDIADEDLPF